LGFTLWLEGCADIHTLSHPMVWLMRFEAASDPPTLPARLPHQPNRHLRASLKDVRSSMACVGEPSAVREGPADRRVKSQPKRELAIPQDLSSPIPGRSMRTLVIEDEPQDRGLSRSFARAVARDRPTLCIVSRCQQALSNFQYDLAIIDRCCLTRCARHRQA